MKQQLKVEHGLTIIENNAGLDLKGEMNAQRYAYELRGILDESKLELQDQLYKLCKIKNQTDEYSQALLKLILKYVAEVKD